MTMEQSRVSGLYYRRAIRSYTSGKVDERTIKKLLDVAVQTPCSTGEHALAFVVVQNTQLLKSISNRVKEDITANAQWKTESAWSDLPLDDPDFHVFYEARTLIVVCAQNDCFDSMEDCFFVGGNLILNAHRLGLATCPVVIAGEVLQSEKMKKELEIPPGYTPVLPVIVGFPRDLSPRVERRSPVIFLRGGKEAEL